MGQQGESDRFRYEGEGDSGAAQDIDLDVSRAECGHGLPMTNAAQRVRAGIRALAEGGAGNGVWRDEGELHRYGLCE